MDMWEILFVTSIYVATFFVGIFGNLWVVFALYRSRICFIATRRSIRPFTPSERSRIFIFVLAVADLVVLMTIPFSLAQILQKKWSFGSLLCRLHASIELSGKFFSVIILTAMSMERYLVVCTKWRYTISRACTTVVPLSMGVILSVLLPAIPPIIYTQYLTDGNTTSVICIDNYPAGVGLIFAHYMFVVGFALPLTIMGICYYSLVQHVRQKFQQRYENREEIPTTNPVQRPRYICELTRSIWRVAIFHFTCWAPYWFFKFVPVLVETFRLPYQVNHLDWFIKGDLFANILPLVNSAGTLFYIRRIFLGNWIFYAFLNQEVRKHLYYRRRNKQEICESFTYTLQHFPKRPK